MIRRPGLNYSSIELLHQEPNPLINIPLLDVRQMVVHAAPPLPITDRIRVSRARSRTNLQIPPREHGRQIILLPLPARRIAVPNPRDDLLQHARRQAPHGAPHHDRALRVADERESLVRADAALREKVADDVARALQRGEQGRAGRVLHRVAARGGQDLRQVGDERVADDDAELAGGREVGLAGAAGWWTVSG